MLENSKIFNNAKKANYNHNCMFQTSTNDTINIDFRSFIYVYFIFGARKEEKTNKT